VVRFQRKTVSVAELVRRAIEPIAIPMELKEQQIDVFMEGMKLLSEICPGRLKP